MMRAGLRQAMAQQPHFTVVGEAATGELALKLAQETKPDLVVMDIHLADMNGLEATRQILRVLPATKVVIFSGDDASPTSAIRLQKSQFSGGLVSQVVGTVAPGF